MSVDKYDEPDQRSAELNVSNRNQQGFADPAGQYPKRDYLFEPSTNKASRSRSRNELSLGGGYDGLSVDIPTQQESRYPHNQVMETTSGHIIEIDDTPGGERVLIKHNSGSGVEFRSDGTVITKTEANSITSVAGSSCIIVEGEADMKFNGNLNLSVAGDFNLDVGGNINMTSGGNKKETINGSSRETVYGSKGSVVRSSRSETTTGPVVRTGLGGLNEIVKGDYRKSIQGNEIHGVTGGMKVTASDQMAISSNNINMAAESLSVFGASGTIGGENIVHYGITYYGDTFHGDLQGTATLAERADVTNSQTYPQGATGSSLGYSASNDTTATAKPTSSIMSDYLEQSANGVMKVKIDEGDFLKKMVDRSDENAGISERPMTTREIRSALREPNNMSNSTFVGNAFSAGKLGSTYANTIPSGVGRMANSSGQVKIPSQPLPSTLSRINRFQSTKNLDVSSFTPNPLYDVNNVNVITAQTELDRGIRLARFLGAVGDRVTLSHIPTQDEKKKIARQFMLQAKAVKTILNNRGEFKDHRLVVVEGLYKKGPGETLTPGSTNDRATRGEVVVYELHDASGKPDLDKTFDLALYWKDNLSFDELQLSYDTFNTDGSLTGQIVLVMPEVDSDYNIVGGRYKNKLVTLYNNNVQGNELIEITS